MDTGQPSETRLLRRTPGVEEAPLQGELMLFDPGTSKFFVLNRTMSFVWRRCDGDHTVESMVRDLPAEFQDVNPAAAEEDLRRAVAELGSLGLLVQA